MPGSLGRRAPKPAFQPPPPAQYRAASLLPTGRARRAAARAALRHGRYLHDGKMKKVATGLVLVGVGGVMFAVNLLYARANVAHIMDPPPVGASWWTRRNVFYRQGKVYFGILAGPLVAAIGLVLVVVHLI